MILVGVDALREGEEDHGTFTTQPRSPNVNNMMPLLLLKSSFQLLMPSFVIARETTLLLSELW
jgi:hypothetical protein